MARPRLSPQTILALAAASLALVLSACSSTSGASPPIPSSSLGIVQDRPVPNVPLVDQQGRPTSLSAYRGKIVMMTPFLSLCQDECPLVTGAFISMQRDVRAAGLGGQVVFMGVSVDPDRDSPARLAAYSQEFGADWPLLTGTADDIAKLWKFFGVYYSKVPEGQPPQLDWWTHQPLTYDVSHSDGFILIDPTGHERFITVAAPNLHGQLSPSLKSLLGAEGVNGLEHPQSPSWTVSDALSALGWLAGRNIPQSG